MTEILFLADFSVIKPDFGLFFWSTIIFLIFWFGMGKMAFKPIQEALKKREGDIQDSLDQAKNARAEMEALNAKNEELLAQAREERAQILKDAKAAKESIIKDATADAKAKAQKIVESATKEIENQKMAAMVELKNQVGEMALDIATKVLQKELKSDNAQVNFVDKLVKDIKLN